MQNVKMEVSSEEEGTIYVETVYENICHREPVLSTFRNMAGADVYLTCVRKHGINIKSCEIIPKPDYL